MLMRWKDRTKEWQKRFALMPIWIDGFWVWLEYYERRVRSETEVGPIFEERLIG